MKKVLFVLFVCVLMGGFAFAATAETVTVKVNVANFAEVALADGEDETISWYFTSPTAGNYNFTPETRNLVLNSNYAVTLTESVVDSNNSGLEVYTDFAGAADAINYSAGSYNIPVVYSNNFSIDSWWLTTSNGGVEETVIFTYTITAQL